MTAVLSTRCRECGTPLTDRLSRRYSIGPECRKGMSPEQLADALRANQPGYIPQDRRPSAQALANNATAVAETRLCAEHGGVAGRCPQCRRENDPWHCADRIIALIRRQRDEQRQAAYEAWQAAHRPEPQQLGLEES